MSSVNTFTIGEAQDFIHDFVNSSAGGMLPAREAKLFKEIRESPYLSLIHISEPTRPY